MEALRASEGPVDHHMTVKHECSVAAGRNFTTMHM